MSVGQPSSTGANSAVSIGATAGVIVDGTGRRRSVLIQNVHATQILYVGTTSGVTTSNGIRVNAGESIEFSDYIGPVYGIASGAATDIRVFEVG